MIVPIATSIAIGLVAGVLALLSCMKQVQTPRQAVQSSFTPLILGLCLGLVNGFVVTLGKEQLTSDLLVFCAFGGAVLAPIPCLLLSVWVATQTKKRKQMAERAQKFLLEPSRFLQLSRRSGVIQLADLQGALEKATSKEERKLLAYIIAEISVIGHEAGVNIVKDESSKASGLFVGIRQPIFHITLRDIYAFVSRIKGPRIGTTSIDFDSSVQSWSNHGPKRASTRGRSRRSSSKRVKRSKRNRSNR